MIITKNRIKVFCFIVIIFLIARFWYQKFYIALPKNKYSYHNIASGYSIGKIPQPISKPSVESRSLPTFLSMKADTVIINAQNITSNSTDKIKPDFSNVIFIGDSITYGFIKSDNTPIKKDHVYAKIGAHVFEGSKLLGNNSEAIQKHCSGSVDYIFLMFGANDYGYDMKLYKGWYIDLIEYVKKMFPKAKIVLQSVMPMKSTPKEPNRDIEPERLNKVVKDVAKEENVKYIDISGSIPDACNFLLIDGLHYKPDLYPLWINVIKKTET